MTFNSLNSIIDDIFLLLRNNNISESENLSKIQVEQWIHQYRALLIKQDLDKGRDINPGYIQTIGPIHISKVGCLPGKYEYVSDTMLPKFLDLHFKTGLICIKDLYGNLIQVGTEAKAKYQSSRKYTCKDYIAYIKNNRLYISGPEHLEYVVIEGVLEDPTKTTDCYDYDSLSYPIPVNLIPALKELIFAKELNIILAVPSDNTNNSINDVTNNNRGN